VKYFSYPSLLLLFACSEATEPPEAPAPPAAAPNAEASITAGPQVVYHPPEVRDTAWLATRAKAQAAQAASWKTFHDFGFRDVRSETGIDWSHAIVDDAAIDYKGVHYDHGTAVAVADVDGDGKLDLYFVNQLGNNALWKNKGGGRFEDVTFEAGVAVFESVCVGASFADTDNDGDPDLYVTTVKEGNLLFENDGTGKFSDVTADSGLGYQGHSSGAMFFDYDEDGLLDLFVANIGVYTKDQRGPGRYWLGFDDAFSGHLKPERTEKSRLFRNLGGNRFEDVTEKTGLDDGRWSGDAYPFDVNADGWTDLYVLNMQGFDGYWENQGGERFVDKTAEKFPRSSWGAMGIGVLDLENDGDFDILITDMHSDMSEDVPPTYDDEKRKANMKFSASFLEDGGKGIYGNSFFRNDGSGGFEEVSDAIGAENFWPWGLTVADLNADGYDDAFIASSMNYPFRYAINSVFLNEGGTRFVDAEFVLGVEPREGELTKDWFVLDCAGKDKYHDRCPKEGSPGDVTIRGALGSRASVVFDVDEDGDLDIITNEFNAEPMVLMSDLAEKRAVRHLSVALEGTRSNRNGFGAIVTVVAGGREIVQLNAGKSGYLAQSVKPLYFGLGDAETASEVRVVWPSGATQKVAGPIESGKAITIKEPGA
jgi:hypothetical protein